MVSMMQEETNQIANACTKDGSFDRHGKPAIKEKTGGWKSGMLLLGTFCVTFLVLCNLAFLKCYGCKMLAFQHPNC